MNSHTKPQTERPHLVQFVFLPPPWACAFTPFIHPSVSQGFGIPPKPIDWLGFFAKRHHLLLLSPQLLSRNHLFILILSPLYIPRIPRVFSSFTTERYFIRIRRTCLHQLPFILSCDRVVAVNGTSVTKIIAGLYFFSKFSFSLSFGRYHTMIKQRMRPINIRGDAARSVQMVRFRFRSQGQAPPLDGTR